MDLKRCLTTHSLLHTLLGIGLGIILVALVPTVGGLLLGVVVVVVALVLDFLMGGKKE